MSVDVANETQWTIDPKQFSDLGVWVLNQMRVSPDAELSLTFVDPETIAALHERWMGLKGPTDVMSFPMDQLRPGDPDQPSPAGILGDILICPDVAARQAQAAGHSTIEEMVLLTCHGMLHLLGFDHATHEQEKQMFQLQRTLMLTFLAQREGGLKEVVLPAGATDMLAIYEKQHPETLAIGHETILGSKVHAPQQRGREGTPSAAEAKVQQAPSGGVPRSGRVLSGPNAVPQQPQSPDRQKTGSTKPAAHPDPGSAIAEQAAQGDADSADGSGAKTAGNESTGRSPGKNAAHGTHDDSDDPQGGPQDHSRKNDDKNAGKNSGRTDR